VPTPAIPPQATPTPPVPSAASPSPAPIPPKPEVTPEQYLTQAAQVFMSVSQVRLKSGDARKRADDLKQHFAQLLSAYKANADPFVPPAALQATDRHVDQKAAPMNWKMAFSDVESDLAGILGGGSVLPATLPAGSTGGVVPVGTAGTVPVAEPPSGNAAPVPNPNTGVVSSPGTPGVSPPGTPVGTNPGGAAAPAIEPSTGAVAAPGTTPAAAGAGTAPQIGAANAGAIAAGVGVKDLDPNVRAQFEQFRREIELFFAAALRAGT
jgi:hypothetical protein